MDRLKQYKFIPLKKVFNIGYLRELKDCLGQRFFALSRTQQLILSLVTLVGITGLIGIGIAVATKSSSVPIQMRIQNQNRVPTSDVLGEGTQQSEASSEANPKKDASNSATKKLTVTNNQLPEGLNVSLPNTSLQTNQPPTPLEQVKQFIDKVVEKVFPTPPDTTTVASVGADPIYKSTLETELKSRLSYLNYDKRPPSDVSKVEQAVLDQLIDDLIIYQLATKAGIAVSQTELETHYQKAVASYGNEQEYLKKVAEIHNLDKTGLLERMKGEILKEKLQQQLKIPLDQWLTVQKHQLLIKKGSL